MNNITESYISEYIREILPQRNNTLKKMEEYATENNIPIIYPEVAQLLRVLLNIKNAKYILEVGTAIGYSALVMAECIKPDGKIITIERRDDMINIAKEYLKESKYGKKIEIIKGEAETVLPEINQKFDFIFLDAAKGKYMDFLPYCIDNLNDRGIIVSDNVLFKGMVANDSLVIRRKKTIVKRMREYLKFICNNPTLETSIIPIGDGVALTYKKEVNQ